MLSDVGRIPDALVAARRAVQLDDAPIRRLNLAGILWADDRTDEGLEQLRRGIRMDAEGAVPILRGTWYLRNMSLGDFEGALEFGYPDGMLANLTRPQHEQFVRALRAGDATLLPSEHDSNWPLVAVTWEAFGDRSLGLTAIENTMALNPHGNLIFLRLPPLDPLRGEPRFRALLERFNLPDASVRRTPREAAGTP
jgi:hypothetical protein